MIDISFMSYEERVFLAGCIETIVVSDSNIEENELENLDKTLEEINFKDFDDCLSKFEDHIKDNDTFFERAKTIINQNTKDAILEILYEFVRSNGIPGKTEESFLERLQKLWE